MNQPRPASRRPTARPSFRPDVDERGEVPVLDRRFDGGTEADVTAFVRSLRLDLDR